MPKISNAKQPNPPARRKESGSENVVFWKYSGFYGNGVQFMLQMLDDPGFQVWQRTSSQ